MPQPRLILTVITALGALALVGCQRYTKVPPGVVKDEPVVIDEAMQIRDWEPSSARYTNPRFIAGPPGFWFIPKYDMPEPLYAVQETPMFILQAVGLPLTMWFPPPWTPVEYAGETLEPTWHAMPPLPEARYGEPPAPAEVTERGTDEPMPVPTEPGAEPPPAPYEEAPGETVIPATQPTRGLEMEREPAAPATQPGAAAPATPRTVTTPAPAARPATQPAVTYTPSAVAPARATPATRATTVPARDMNK